MTKECSSPIIFRHFPELEQKLAWMPLGTFPTPVTRLIHLGCDNLWIKRDDLSSAVYVGNKVSTLTDPFLLYPLAAIQKGLGPALQWLHWNRLLGIMVKLKDDISGGIYPDGKIRKPLTQNDIERLNHAYNVCRRI
jgi:hypothetical protein